ncbi:MAG: 2OG-Fe(II) oxygenase [Bacteriovorax sp.]|nr:2OG-Fe(II) oxygenase [Bacteriovorax sp.]
MIKNTKLFETGHVIADFPLPPIILNMLQTKNWKLLDDYFLDISRPNGLLRNFLAAYLEFETLEHIIAIRKSPEDEDGIWHDDGSRFLGFSLSLNQNPENIVGGELRFKSKESDNISVFPPQNYGKIILFLSGIYGYEHMVSAVTKGERVVIAGWCS